MNTRSAAPYSDCQKNVPVFDRFFLQPYTLLCRVSLIRNKILKSGIKSVFAHLTAFEKTCHLTRVFFHLLSFCHLP